VQLGGPDDAVAIDPLAPGIDLAPLFALMADPAMLKVFHAARQDIEIFVHLTGTVPTPLFDTQVAAMVCGFGDSASYETLVSKLANERVDKSSRFSDWAHRPLTERQLVYALSDVTHLRPVYERLQERIEAAGRAAWLAEEMAYLSDPGIYRVEPAEAWRRLKIRPQKPRFMAILQEVAAWREREAQRRDMPRNFVLRDEAILEIASHAPGGVEDLARMRGIGRSFAEGRQGTDLLAAVATGLQCPEADAPKPDPRAELPAGIGPIIELLRVLLKLKCDDHDVAAKLVASASDLEAIAADDNADVPALTTPWRRELFGDDALALKHGRLALAITEKRVRLVALASEETVAPPT
jgi:ribonuclease D